MAKRTHEQVLDEIVHAVACAAHHYGPRLNESGLALVRERLTDFKFYTDACFCVDRQEDAQFIDFHQRIICPDGWDLDTFQTGRTE